MIQDECPLCDMRTDTGGICRNCSNRRILHGDVLEQLKRIPDETIHCTITSPPYWGLRDYGVDGQLGLEPDFFDYLKKLSNIMKELKRILKPDGTVWFNIADTYFNKKTGSDAAHGLHGKKCKCGTCESRRKKKIINPVPNVKIGSKCRIPARFYIDCLNDGWICKNDLCWFKPNSMPDSVENHFPNTWEPIFLFTKTLKYYLDIKSIEIQSKSKLFETKRQKDVFEIPIKKFHGFHTATFPETLIEKIIKCGCPPDGIVLDPFFGSGTVGVVAEKLNRKWMGIELNQEYITLARKRLETKSLQKIEAFF